jgi:hypothetical protein
MMPCHDVTSALALMNRFLHWTKRSAPVVSKIMPFFSLQTKQQAAINDEFTWDSIIEGSRYQTTDCKVKQSKAFAR